MRFSDNHDERRAIARFGEPAALAASALVFTLDGVPMLYNGMEVGDTTESGAPALFERLPVFWPIGERRPEFGRFYKQIILLRRTDDALRRGSFEWLHNSDESRVVTYIRQTPREEIVVAINLSSRPFSGTVEIGGSSGYQEVGFDIGSPFAARRTGSAAFVEQAINPITFVVIRCLGIQVFQKSVLNCGFRNCGFGILNLRTYTTKTIRNPKSQNPNCILRHLYDCHARISICVRATNSAAGTRWPGY
jgi:hypothetical protein